MTLISYHGHIFCKFNSNTLSFNKNKINTSEVISLFKVSIIDFEERNWSKKYKFYKDFTTDHSIAIYPFVADTVWRHRICLNEYGLLYRKVIDYFDCRSPIGMDASHSVQHHQTALFAFLLGANCSKRHANYKRWTTTETRTKTNEIKLATHYGQRTALMMALDTGFCAVFFSLHPNRMLFRSLHLN